MLDHRMQGSVDVNDPTVQEQLGELRAFGCDMDAEVRVKKLRAALEELPPKCRAAVVLAYWNNLTYAQIAQELGISTHMVKKYLSRALVHCRRRMARFG
jgi:RNA polymerase sigma-70 factor (ECF subfamily)